MPRRQAHLRRIHHWLANRGIRGVLKEIVYRLRLLAQGKPMPGSAGRDPGAHPFDLTYGVDTSGLVWGEELGNSRERKESHYWVTGYYGIAPSAFTSALEKLALDWSRFTFVDIGCGKGRAMLAALRFPFHHLMGVELSPELVHIASSNLERFTAPWRQPGVSTEALAADASDFPIPAGPLVLFLYHPFAAPVMKRFLAHLGTAAKAEARDILLLYANPELASQVLATPGVVQLWRESFALSAEDSAADRFDSTYETFAAYRLRP